MLLLLKYKAVLVSGPEETQGWKLGKQPDQVETNQFHSNRFHNRDHFLEEWMERRDGGNNKRKREEPTHSCPEEFSSLTSLVAERTMGLTSSL